MTVHKELFEKRSSDEDLRRMVEKNLKLTEDLHEKVKKINRFVVWSQIMGFIKIVLILGPIIIGIIFLPPLLKDVFKEYRQILEAGTGAAGVDLNSLSPGLSDIFKK